MGSTTCFRRSYAVQYALTALVSLSGLVAGAWLTWPSTASKLLLNGTVCCHADEGEVSTMVALMDLGNMLTPIPASYLSDMYGRKPVILSTAALFTVASICVMVADSMWYMYAARLLAGMGKGIGFGVIPILVAEFAQVEIRGSLGTIFNTLVSLGISYDYIMGLLLSYQGLNIANLVVPIVFGIGYLFMPESPYFLVIKGREKQALRSLSTYRQLPITDDDLKDELSEIKSTVEEDIQNKSRFIDVVTTKSRRRALMISSLTAFFQRAAGISPLLAFSTTALPEQGGGASREVYVIIFSFLMFIGNYIGISLVDKWGRKMFLILSASGCAVAQCVFGIFFSLRASGMDMTELNWIPYASLLFFGFIWGLGLCFIPSVLVSELFPTNIKSYAGSIQSIMFALASFLANKIFGLSISSPHVMFFVFSGSCVICTIFTVLFIFETTGKTFPEIQRELKKATGETILDEKISNGIPEKY